MSFINCTGKCNLLTYGEDWTGQVENECEVQALYSCDQANSVYSIGWNVKSYPIVDSHFVGSLALT